MSRVLIQAGDAHTLSGSYAGTSQWPTHGVVTQCGAPPLAEVPHAMKALPHEKQEPE
jgi:hypothetical protein